MIVVEKGAEIESGIGMVEEGQTEERGGTAIAPLVPLVAAAAANLNDLQADGRANRLAQQRVGGKIEIGAEAPVGVAVVVGETMAPLGQRRSVGRERSVVRVR